MSTHNSAIVAITKQGIRIARKIKENIGDVDIYVPAKYDDSKKDINWFEKQTGEIIASLFERDDNLYISLGSQDSSRHL
jgi:hypothetical protein